MFYPAKEIVPNLWIGSEGDSRDATFVRDHRIRFIVNGSRTIPFSFARVPSYRVPVDDAPWENETMGRHLPVVVRAIDDVLRRGDGVLVHCRAGMQRSATVVAGYLMWKRALTADQAIAFIKAKKAETFEPVPTFRKALDRWEAKLAAKRVKARAAAV